jgi:hypothetical protein
MSDILSDVIRLARTFKPMPRIIVGMPCIASDTMWKRESDGLLLIGRCAYEAISKAVPIVPHPLGTLDTLMGIRIEFFGDRADHENLMREIFEAIARGALLRIALDEEFGNTNPTLPASWHPDVGGSRF